MKSKIKIIYSVLIVLSIVCMFLPIAEFRDNRAAAQVEVIRKEEASMDRSVEKLGRENDKVVKEMTANAVYGSNDELKAEKEAVDAAIKQNESDIRNLNNFVATSNAVKSLDRDFSAQLSELIKIIKEDKSDVENAMNDNRTKKSEVEKLLSAAGGEVETEDENGDPIVLKDLLQKEVDENPDVFATRPDDGAEFMSWKEALDAKREELEGSAAKGGLSVEEEEYVTTSLADSDKRYIVMIKIIRQQVAIDALAADPAADPDVVASLQKAQDAVYKQLKKVNKEQAGVNELIAVKEALEKDDSIKPISIALLPGELPVPNNNVNSMTADVEAKAKEIVDLETRIAEIEAFIVSATAESIADATAAKADAEQKLAVAEEEKAGLLVKLAEAEAAVKTLESPVLTDEEAEAKSQIADLDKKVQDKKRVIKNLDSFIATATDIKALYTENAVVLEKLEAVLTVANQLKDEEEAEIAEFEAESMKLLDATSQADAATKQYEAALKVLTAEVDKCQKEVDNKAAEIAALKDTIQKNSDYIADASAEGLAAKEAEKASLSSKLEKAQAYKNQLDDELNAHKFYLLTEAGLKAELEKVEKNIAKLEGAELEVAEATKAKIEAKLEEYKAENKNDVTLQDIRVDMMVANASAGKAYPTVFDDYNLLKWVAFGMLVLALIFVWIPGGKISSRFYTYASFANLIGVVILAFVILRLGAIPIEQPYSNPIINSLVAIPLLLLPVVALLMHCSTVTNTKRTMIYVLCIALSVLSLLPFWLMIVNATRNSQQIQGGVSLIPSTFLGHNWGVLQSKSFDVMVGFKNSAIIAFGSTILSVYFSALTAYGLSAYKFKGSKIMYAIILAIIMIPGQVTGTGFYMFMFQLGWTNSYLPLIVPAIAGASTVFFFKQYLEANFQVSLVEAARIDGAGEFYTYNKIVMPIMVPAMATMGIMAIIGSWNNYLTPLMLLSDPTMKTLPMMVKELRGDIYRTEYGSIYLGLTLTALPLMIVYFALSKYIIAGIAVGGVKE